MPRATGTTSTDNYALLKRLASTDEAGGLAKERSVLLLWFLRNIVGLDDLDAYEFVCDGDADGGVDGIYVEPSTGDEDHETLIIYQSKYTTGPTQVGPTAFDRLLATTSHFKDIASLETFLTGRVEPKLRDLIKRFDLCRKLRENRFRRRAAADSTGARDYAHAHHRGEQPRGGYESRGADRLPHDLRPGPAWGACSRRSGADGVSRDN